MEKLRGINLYGLTEDRKNHILGVADKVIEHYLFSTLQESSKMDVVLSALYHDVGYAKELEIQYGVYDDHPLVGFKHLQKSGVSSTVTKLVLHHTYSELMTTMKNGDLEPYVKNKLTSRERKLLFILNSSDVTTSSKGHRVTINERFDDILRRYGSDHIVSHHFHKVIQLHRSSAKHFLPHRSLGKKYIEKEKQYWKEFVVSLLNTDDVLSLSLKKRI